MRSTARAIGYTRVYDPPPPPPHFCPSSFFFLGGGGWLRSSANFFVIYAHPLLLQILDQKSPKTFYYIYNTFGNVSNSLNF